MKLININNLNQTNGIINAHFQSNIHVEPYSKIALLNLSFQFDEKSFIIDDTNDELLFKISGGTPDRKVKIRNALYIIDGFEEEVTEKMNAAIPCEGGVQIGFQWKVEWSDVKDNFNIMFNRIPTVNNIYYFQDKIHNSKNLNIDNVNHGFTKTSANRWDAAAVSQFHFIGGTGVISCLRPNVRNHSVIVGLVDSNDLDDYDDDFSVDSYDYAIYSAPPSANPAGDHVYWYKLKRYGEIEIEETNIDAGNHQIGLMLSEGNLLFFYYNDQVDDPLSNNVTVIYEFNDWEPSEQFYGMMSIYDDGESITNTNFWPDPYESHPPTNELGGANASIVSLDVEDANGDINGLGKLLGFRTQPDPINAKDGTFEPEDDTTALDGAGLTTVKVLLDSLQVDSIDNYSKIKSSILMTIPEVGVQSVGEFTYSWQAPFLLGMDINNEFPMELSEIRLRLVDYKDELLHLKENDTNLTLIIYK